MSNLKFDVWCPDLGSGPDDARVFEAFDAEHAAAEWADWHDGYSADYSIVSGQNERVCVREYGGEEVLEYIVSGRMRRDYSALAVNELPR